MTERSRHWLRRDPDVTIWAFTRLELLSAISRRRREQPNETDFFQRTRERLLNTMLLWTEITDIHRVRANAERLVELYPLRAADALQLGAALVAAEGKPESLEFITFDRRLAHAAMGERFRVPAGE